MNSLCILYELLEVFVIFCHFELLVWSNPLENIFENVFIWSSFDYFTVYFTVHDDANKSIAP